MHSIEHFSLTLHAEFSDEKKIFGNCSFSSSKPVIIWGNPFITQKIRKILYTFFKSLNSINLYASMEEWLTHIQRWLSNILQKMSFKFLFLQINFNNYVLTIKYNKDTQFVFHWNKSFIADALYHIFYRNNHKNNEPSYFPLFNLFEEKILNIEHYKEIMENSLQSEPSLLFLDGRLLNDFSLRDLNRICCRPYATSLFVFPDNDITYEQLKKFDGYLVSCYDDKFFSTEISLL